MHTIDELRALFIDYLKSESLPKEPHNLYSPNEYFLQIGGKRLRPVLLLLATDLFEGNVDKALPAALAIEYFHNFTLIHDDVMDHAPTRRGFQTIHEKYNLNTAILSGDVLLVKAYEMLGRIPAANFHKIFSIYTKTAIEVCEGQQYDIDFESRAIVTHEEYIEMIRLKTSVLLAASMQIGALLGNATDEDAKLLYSYAENLGIAFQIQDDILDCYGDEALVGKQPGGDILQNKKTLLMIEAMKYNDVQLLQFIHNKDIKSSEKIDGVLEIFEKYNIKSFALEQRDYFVNKSLSVLKDINLPDTKKNILKSLVEHLVVRNF
jgi:geranylgeranyl diphosphate synthase type II